ncbi:MAG TPA: tetratricopeptide repeat protein [Polyangiaceae bacterium]|nr:tetratricopeptide repeat protein [Polyangiaceae bacterium]
MFRRDRSFSLARPLRLLLGAPLLASLLTGCGLFGSSTPGDPTRMSEAEFDVAADLWWRQHDPREALKHALRAAELDTDNADAAHLVSLIYLDFCQNSQIDECRLGEAETYAKRAITAKRDYIEAQNTLAVIYIHQKRPADAIRMLEPITENILYATPEIAWGNLGWAYLEKGDSEHAISALRRAVAAQPLFCVGNYRLGVAYHHVGQLESSRDALDRALETDAPGCGNLQDAYLERARVHLALGELEMTRADLDRCIVLQKTNQAGRACGRMLTTLQ